MKTIKFVNGVCEKSIPEDVRILGVYTDSEKSNRVPHRIVKGTLEIRTKTTGDMVVEYAKLVPAPLATFYPLKDD